MKSFNHRSFWPTAVVAALLITASAAAQSAEPFMGSFRIAPGQSIHEALREAQLKDRMAAGRAQWLAQHGLVSGGSTTAVSTEDSTLPSILGGSVVSTTLTVGNVKSVPELKFSYSTGSAGLVGASFYFSSPSGAQSLEVDYDQGAYSTSGAVTFASPNSVAAFSEPGVWTLSGAAISDNAYNYTSYTAAQLAGVFPAMSFTVVNNGIVDVTPPIVTGGKIATPTVSFSDPIPAFAANLVASDAASGVALVYVAVRAPGSGYSQVNFFLQPHPSAPGATGVFKAYSQLFAGQPAGTWSITEYAACDIAGNCFAGDTPDAVQTLFGTTTFTVTD